jgi:hypothetical protein
MASGRARSSSMPRAALLWPERVTPVPAPRPRSSRSMVARDPPPMALTHPPGGATGGRHRDAATSVGSPVPAPLRPHVAVWECVGADPALLHRRELPHFQPAAPGAMPVAAADRGGLVPAECLESDRGWMLPPLWHPLRGAVRGTAGGLRPPPTARGPSPTPLAALGPRGIVLEPSGLPLAARDGEARVIEDDPAQREQQHRSIVAGDPDGLLGRARARLPGGAVVA